MAPMTRRFLRAALPVAALTLLVGCGGQDDPVTPTTSGTSTSTTQPSSGPSETTDDPPDGGATIEAFIGQIEQSDARMDAQAVAACARFDAADPACATEVEAMALSAQGLADQLDALGTPPAEIADLVAATIATALAAQDAAESYTAACPDAGATSEQCQTELSTLISGPGKDLVTTVKGWKEYLAR
jgi:hypothetical protein